MWRRCQAQSFQVLSIFINLIVVMKDFPLSYQYAGQFGSAFYCPVSTGRKAARHFAGLPGDTTLHCGNRNYSGVSFTVKPSKSPRLFDPLIS